MSWTPDRIELLTRLWSQGVSTIQIGKTLGVTKNAVVGKAHRLGLQERQSPIAKKPVAKVIEIHAHSCRWPEGHPGEKGFHFCGKQAINNKPYCAEHVARAYIHHKERKEERKAENAA